MCVCVCVSVWARRRAAKKIMADSSASPSEQAKKKAKREAKKEQKTRINNRSHWTSRKLFCCNLTSRVGGADPRQGGGRVVGQMKLVREAAAKKCSKIMLARTSRTINYSCSRTLKCNHIRQDTLPQSRIGVQRALHA